MKKVMLEAAEAAGFNWYIRKFVIDVNLIVYHRRIVQSTYLRYGFGNWRILLESLLTFQF